MKNLWLPLITLSVAGSLTTVVAHAGPVALDSVTWSATGAAGIVSGGSTVPNSPSANTQFGYVTTFNGTTDVSPLTLQDEGKGTKNQTNGTKITSSSFVAKANETLSLFFNYVSTDGRGYADYAWARLVHSGSNTTAAWLFTARSNNSATGNVVPGDVLKRQVDNNLPDELDAVLNDGNTIGFDDSGTTWDPLGASSGSCWDSANTCGPTGWIKSAYSIAAEGSYFLEFGVTNWGDEVFDSALAFDYGGLRAANFSNVTIEPTAPLTGSVPEPGTFALLGLGFGLMNVLVSRRKTHQSR